VMTAQYDINGVPFEMYDVGGQRNERRKWIHCFDNVTAVIFVTAISEYDQVLYEDENTNRMDEATTLFDQICNHQSFKKTSMILFLNKRDLFADKLKKKDMRDWKQDAADKCGQDYDKNVAYITQEFHNKNKDPANRQVYCHATCATDTKNVSFVMGSVFDIILKENLRKMETVDVDKLLGAAAEGGVSNVKPGLAQWTPGTIILVSCQFTENLKERKVLVEAANAGRLPGVEMQVGKIDSQGTDWSAVMELGKNVPCVEPTKGETGTFIGDFKGACVELRSQLGMPPDGDLGFVYDAPVFLESKKITLVVCVLNRESSEAPAPKFKWASTHEEFENLHYPEFDGRLKGDCKAPDKNEEFNPFAANPVGARWFKGVTLFTAAVSAIPDKGVYLGLLRVCSSSSGFQIMVNEHNRIMIPMIFLTCTQLTPDELKWMQGVRVRWSKGVKLLEGQKPNRGWLGPEMSGEEGATFPEKLWWAIDEAKARLDTDSLGEFYDTDVIDVDENDNIQLVLFAALAKGEEEILPGHVWVDRSFLEIQNMKYLCPKTLKNLLAQQANLVNEYAVHSAHNPTPEELVAHRAKKDNLKAQIKAAATRQGPLKWVNRVIMWCADKMPSFADKIEGAADMDAAALIDKAISANTLTSETKAARKQLLVEFNK